MLYARGSCASSAKAPTPEDGSGGLCVVPGVGWVPLRIPPRKGRGGQVRAGCLVVPACPSPPSPWVEDRERSDRSHGGQDSPGTLRVWLLLLTSSGPTRRASRRSSVAAVRSLVGVAAWTLCWCRRRTRTTGSCRGARTARSATSTDPSTVVAISPATIRSVRFSL